MLDGYAEHGDSMGHKGTIGPGDVQWMTAGSGIIHQEMPKGDKKGVMGGFQLWANLPAANKMMDPRYRDVGKSIIPEISMDNGVKVKIICGRVNGVEGPVKDIVIDPEYIDVAMPADASFSHPTKTGHTVLAYVIEGEGYFDKGKDSYAYEVEGVNYFDFKRECLVGAANLVIFHDGDQVLVTTKDKPLRFLLISGKPIKEPVAWYGPIVMNTQQELKIAFEEYQNNTFIKHKRS
jgi:hypothetical protein